MAKVSDLKKENIKAVRKCFFQGNTWSSNEITANTGLSHGSVINVLKQMEDNHEILLFEKTGTSVGRKTNRYIINKNYCHFLTIDTKRNNGEFLSIIRRVNLMNETEDTIRYQFKERDENYLHYEIDTMMEKYPDTCMVLISTPGMCTDGNVMISEEMIFPIGTYIKDKWHVPYVVENDVNVACIGFHHENKAENIAIVYQADNTIFGCGIMIHGKLYNGYSHASGELRYFPFMNDIKEKNIEELLKEQIISVCAVLNPDIIGYYSEVMKEKLNFEDISIPYRHRPSFMQINDFDMCISNGLYSIGIYNLIELTGGIK